MKRKTILLVLVMVMMMSPAFSQSFDDYLEVVREVLNTEKKAAVAETMALSDSESGAFWSLYNEYNSKLYQVHTDRVNIIKDFAASYESMTDEKADALVNRSLAYQTKLLKLNKSYYKKFKKILPASKAALYFQLESKIDDLVNASLALEIPLVNTN
ncbi:hypothetical protein [uncultured Eudoraea sp.]|uniref:hypothetical protein n=1 Tax=uncultured Eudoraea sp. TaxID=1035614 RepID=UPI00260D0B4E|nr:hypothetical protein [uncultured Eudoraea sp.]